MAVEQDAPALTPVTVGEVRAYLRIEGEEEDATIAALIRAATGHCEAFIGQALIARAVRETVPVSSEWRRLSITPVRSIDGIGALAPEAYAIDIDAHGDGWVRILSGGDATRLTVTYEAGIAVDWNGIAEPVRQGIVRLVAHLFTHRDAPDDGGPPAAVAALWRPWRRMRLS